MSLLCIVQVGHIQREERLSLIRFLKLGNPTKQKLSLFFIGFLSDGAILDSYTGLTNLYFDSMDEEAL